MSFTSSADMLKKETVRLALNSFRVPKEQLREWVKRLRSGEYEQLQPQSELSGSYYKNGSKYCCLGVLATVVGDETSIFSSYKFFPILNDIITTDIQNVFVTMNDIEKKTFDEIADFVEQYWCLEEL